MKLAKTDGVKLAKTDGVKLEEADGVKQAETTARDSRRQSRGDAMGDTSYEVHGTIEMVTPDAAANWTGMELIPFETIAERFLDLEHEGHTATLTVSLGKPFVVEGKGWASPLSHQRTGSGALHAGGLGPCDPDGDAYGAYRAERYGAAPSDDLSGEGGLRVWTSWGERGLDGQVPGEGISLNT